MQLAAAEVDLRQQQIAEGVGDTAVLIDFITLRHMRMVADDMVHARIDRLARPFPVGRLRERGQLVAPVHEGDQRGMRKIAA